MCASWYENKSEREKSKRRAAGPTADSGLKGSRSVQAAAGPTRQGDGGSENRAAPDDNSGLSRPGWQRVDRDALDDLISDMKQAEDWERVLPSDGSGIEGYW